MKSRDGTLTEKANAAFRQAAAKVIERARQTGTPVIVWEEGQVIERSCEELEQAPTKRQPKKRASRTAKSQHRAKS
jgi:diaminopimelate decarboxylase